MAAARTLPICGHATLRLGADIAIVALDWQF
jgi:hypothetical protein